MKISTILGLRTNRLRFVLVTLAIIFAVHSSALAQARYKVGDRIEAEWRQGRWYTAQIIEIKNGQYKVRYELDGVIDTVPAERIRRVGRIAPANEANGTTANQPPKMAGAFPSLPGTAWKIDFGKGVTGTVFLFCKAGGRWEIVPERAGSIGAVGRSYTVAGSTLTTVNADDGKVEKWKMTWKDGILEIFDGKASLRLRYNGETKC